MDKSILFYSFIDLFLLRLVSLASSFWEEVMKLVMKIGEKQFLAIPLSTFQISNIIGQEIISPISLKKIVVLWYV